MHVGCAKDRLEKWATFSFPERLSHWSQVMAKLWLIVGGRGWSWVVANGRGCSQDLAIPNTFVFTSLLHH